MIASILGGIAATPWVRAVLRYGAIVLAVLLFLLSIRRAGERVGRLGHRRIGRLMRENDIKIIRTQKFKATTDSNHTFNIAPNLLDQDFSADGPNQKWAGDISYIWTSEGWLYLAVIIDLGCVSNLVEILCRRPPSIRIWA